MRTLAILPVKSFGAAKQRLADVARRRARGRRSRRRCSPTCWARCGAPRARRDRRGHRRPRAPSPPRAASGVQVLARHRAGGPVGGRADRHPARARRTASTACCSCRATRRCCEPGELAGLLSRSGARRRRSCRTATAPAPTRCVLSPPDAIEPSFGPGQPRPPRRAAARRRACASAVERGARRSRSTWTRPTTSPRCGRRSRAPRPGAVHPRRAAPARPRRQRWPPPPSLRLSSFSVTALAPLPDDPARRRPRRADRGGRARRTSRDGDVVVVAHKVVSKAEGRVAPARRRSSRASGRAGWRRSTARTRAWCRPCSTSRPRCCGPSDGMLICVTRHGFVCANAGVDQSNASAAGGELVLLPRGSRRLGARGCARASRPRSACGRRW